MSHLQINAMFFALLIIFLLVFAWRAIARSKSGQEGELIPRKKMPAPQPLPRLTARPGPWPAAPSPASARKGCCIPGMCSSAHDCPDTLCPGHPVQSRRQNPKSSTRA